MLKIADQAVQAARKAGADLADARVVTEDTESLTVRNQEMEGLDRARSKGLGIRVLARGAWGFAATADLSDAAIQRTAVHAVALAHAAARIQHEPVEPVSVEPVTATWHSSVQQDPFEVNLEEKVALLMEASRRMQGVPGVSFAEASLDFFRRRSFFVSSEGAQIEQTVTHAGGGIEATAVGDDDVQRRSFPNSFRGHLAAAGWEHIQRLGLLDEAEHTASEAVELLSARECPTDVTTLILDSGQMELQIHESIGHPIELDRVLGMEEAFAGTSFLTLEDAGRLRYGSPNVTVYADATLPGGLGTFAYDDEGVPAQRTPIIVEGIFQGFMSSRETAATAGLAASSGTMRADGWGNFPLIRMTNVSIEPGEGTLAELIADTDEGIFMATNSSWSIDDKRINFQFGTEIAWRIKHGKIVEPLKDPTYAGITPEFWNSCDAVCGRDEWVLWGTPNCGKGQPMQVARTGHGAAPARFRNVQVGVR